MPRIISLSRYALPVLFLGYAGFVNVSVFTGDGGFGEVEGDIVTGDATQVVNTLYSEAQPHRELAVSALGAARYLALGEGREGVTVSEGGWLFTGEEMTPATPAQMTSAVEGIAAVEARLVELGTSLVLAPIPAKVDIYRDKGSAKAGAAMRMQYDAFRAALADEGIDAVDTRPALARASGDAPVFLTSDTHWTPKGARRVAERIAASGLVPEGDTAFEKVPARPQHFTGDLVSFVTSDALAPHLGLGAERVTPYVAEPAETDGAGGDSIFASDQQSIDAVLVGTSYSANENWSFVPALKIALHRDVLNLAEEGQGPVAPMEAFLGDPALAEAPPEIVIWEYPVRYLGVPASGAANDTPEETEAPHG
ncbi:alginate O-acetyltransferase [Salipiger mucosus]|uniref:Probable alginate O-acetylase AlgJ n=1 Tax=Salipiger mucosus DSM 16094 TaxID=1123237 RepID=S9R225_9RHOB|nr:alginate O-acetyltransferase [Salipiger mucosus]EPX86003.1 Alginate biosynthesis protein AlgJ [Salipiger mucosus DSM 16094]